MSFSDKAVYFAHNSNISSDRRIIWLEHKFGLEGYARFFKLLEEISVSKNYQIELSNMEKFVLINKLKFNSDKDFIDFIDFCTSANLITKIDNIIYSQELLANMAHKDKLSEYKKLNGKKGGRPVTKEVEAINKDEIIFNQDQVIKSEIKVVNQKKYLPSQQEIDGEYKPLTGDKIDFNQFDPSITGKYFIADEYKFLKDCLDENITEYFEIMPDLPYMKNKLEKEAWAKIHDLINTGVLLKMDEPERFILECCQDAIEKKVHKAFQVTHLYNQMVENIELGYDNDPDDELLKNVCKRFKSLHNSTN